MLGFYGTPVASRLMLGTAQYPSPKVMSEAFRRSGAGIATVSVRREAAAGEGADFWALVRELGVRLLPNTAGCHSAREAVTTARLARELFGTDWIKLEVIGHADTLQPDPWGLVEAAAILCAEGFARAVEAGRLGFEAGAMEPRDMAAPSTPLIGKAFLA